MTASAKPFKLKTLGNPLRTYMLSPTLLEQVRIRVLKDNYSHTHITSWIIESVMAFIDPRYWTTPTGEASDAWKQVLAYSTIYRGDTKHQKIPLGNEIFITFQRAIAEAAAWGYSQPTPVAAAPTISTLLREAMLWRLRKPEGWAPDQPIRHEATG